MFIKHYMKNIKFIDILSSIELKYFLLLIFLSTNKLYSQVCFSPTSSPYQTSEQVLNEVNYRCPTDLTKVYTGSDVEQKGYAPGSLCYLKKNYTIDGTIVSKAYIVQGYFDNGLYYACTVADTSPTPLCNYKKTIGDNNLSITNCFNDLYGYSQCVDVTDGTDLKSNCKCYVLNNNDQRYEIKCPPEQESDTTDIKFNYSTEDGNIVQGDLGCPQGQYLVFKDNKNQCVDSLTGQITMDTPIITCPDDYNIKTDFYGNQLCEKNQTYTQAENEVQYQDETGATQTSTIKPTTVYCDDGSIAFYQNGYYNCWNSKDYSYNQSNIDDLKTNCPEGTKLIFQNNLAYCVNNISDNTGSGSSDGTDGSGDTNGSSSAGGTGSSTVNGTNNTGLGNVNNGLATDVAQNTNSGWWNSEISDIYGIGDGLSDILSNFTSAFDTMKENFESVKSLANGNLNTHNLVNSTENCIISQIAFGKKIEIDICSAFAPLRPFFAFIVFLMITYNSIRAVIWVLK